MINHSVTELARTGFAERSARRSFFDGSESLSLSLRLLLHIRFRWSKRNDATRAGKVMKRGV